MSILTKILIILLAFTSLFLCGAVVTYVATASNYRELHDQQKQRADLAEDKAATVAAAAQEQARVADAKIRKSDELIQKLTEDGLKLSVDLKSAQRDSLGHQLRADKWQGLLESYSQTIANLEQSLKSTQTQLDKTRAEGIRDQKELSEVTGSLYEKIVQLQALEAEKRRLLEEKKSAEDKLDKTAVEPASPVAAVTPERTTVIAAEPVVEADLTALVSEVHENLATISIGAADGVKKDMVFHVTRGDEFICDIIITDVDAEKAAGSLNLKQKEPRVGDNASTKLL